MTSPHQTGEALHEQRDWLRVTLSSIGDAVITTDTVGRVTFLNPVGESLTGWTVLHKPEPSHEPPCVSSHFTRMGYFDENS